MNSLDKLFEKYLQDRCSEKELNQLLDYFGEDANKEGLRNLIEANFDLNDHIISADVNSRIANVDEFLFQKIIKENKNTSIKPYLKYAAAIVCALFVSVLAYNRFSSRTETTYVNASKANPEIGKVTLKLASGKQFSLGEADNVKDLPRQVSAKNGVISYDQEQEEAIPEINELSTAAGRMYQVILSDGTKVTLNAMSSLKYPSHFKPGARVVELIGEAFFEVAHRTKNNERVPFFVKTSRQQVEVLGTKFNISSYANDSQQVTTLVSGKVSVSTNSKYEKIFLLPGQQAITNEDGNTTAQASNTESATAWLSNSFMFEDMLLSDILKQISRWYGINVDYTKIPRTRYNVLLSKTATLATVLKYLEDAGKIKFVIKENTIHIK
jgi:transmembrane sensor